MIPGNSLSTEPVPSDFLRAGKQALFDRVIDYEDGPVAEQDVSQGLSYQQWVAWVTETGEVRLRSDNGVNRVLFTPSGEVTDISIAFNQNGDLHYAYVEDGQAKLHWYDTLTSQFITTDLPAGVRTPKITMDDKRPTQQGNSDIILCYIKDDNGLYYRQQRDRFQVERLLHPGPFVMLRQMYMNTGWRLQWLLVPGVPIL